MSGPAAAQDTSRRALPAVLVFTGTVVAVISSLGAPLVPAIAAAHDVPLADAQWSLTITLVVGAVSTPVAGRLGDGPRRRAVMLGALGLVVAGSVLAALPLGFPALLTGRALQGFGLGLTPLAIATARDALAGARSRSTVAALSITVVAGVGLGYPVAGLLADLGGVHAAFWFGAGVSALALLTGALALPPSPDRPARPLDLPGALLLGTGLGAALLALGEGETLGWRSPAVLGLGALSLVTLAGWVAWSLRAAAPLVDLRLARGRTAATAHLAALLVGLANYLLLSSVTLAAQTEPAAGYGFGASVVVAGLVLLPFSAASVLAGRLARLLADRAGPAAVLPAGALVLGVAAGLFALTPGSLWLLCGVMAVAGLGVGGCFAALPALVVAAVPPAETGSAMSLNQVLRYVGFATGSAATATLLEAATPDGSAAPGPGGYTAVALLACGICVLTAVLTRVLPPRRAAA
ncbi:MFS transporter [Blastococcus sp. SYSU D00820]